MTDQLTQINLLGVQVSAVNMDQTLAVIDGWVRTREPHYVCCVPAHSLMATWDEPGLREVFNNSGLAVPDGMGVVWLLRCYGQRQVGRVYGPDLLQAVCAVSVERKYRHYFYGGVPGAADEMVRRLSERYPGLQVAGIDVPPFRELTQEEEAQTIARIQDARPDFIWVGLGSPAQERWMNRMVGRLGAPVLGGVGAAFDFLSGRKPQAPRWMQRIGLEWLFRLVSEPRRLFRRYVPGYLRFIALALAQRIGLLKIQ